MFGGSVANLYVVWSMADCMNALMAIPNLLSLLFLSGIIVQETRKYLWEGNLDMDMDNEELDAAATPSDHSQAKEQ